MANPRTSLYVGGLDDQVTENVLQNAFLAFGDVKSVEIPLDPQTGKSRGFGFVEFEEADDAAEAVDNMNENELFGRVISVTVSKPQAIRRNKAIWEDENAPKNNEK